MSSAIRNAREGWQQGKSPEQAEGGGGCAELMQHAWLLRRHSRCRQYPRGWVSSRT